MHREYVQAIGKVLTVYDCLLEKRRFGGANDGGYIVAPELLTVAPELHSFGIGDDVAFEMEVMEEYPAVAVKMYDPFVEIMVPPPGLHLDFFKDTLPPYGTIMLKPLPGSVLKMDIEYCEWDTLLAMETDVLYSFSMIILEIHLVHAEPRSGLYPYWQGFYERALEQVNRELFRKYLWVLERLDRGYVLTHMHANNSLAPIHIGSYDIPPLLELTYISKNVVRGVAPFMGTLPIPGLDEPNKTNRPDIVDYYPIGGRKRERDVK